MSKVSFTFRLRRYGPAFTRGHCRGSSSGTYRGGPGAGRGPEPARPAVELNFTEPVKVFPVSFRERVTANDKLLSFGHFDLAWWPIRHFKRNEFLAAKSRQ